jgi:hypothetical protein
MLLVIDSESASSSCVGERFAAPLECDGQVRLNIGIQDQILGNWCWAAIASMLGRYYGTSDASQAEIAAQLLGIDCSRLDSDIGLRRSADAEMRLDAALKIARCFGHWSAGKPLFDRIRFEINLGRPFAARIGWNAGAAHYVLVHGYRNEGKRIIVVDPMHGPGEFVLSDFPATYRQGGAWTETFWSNPVGRSLNGDSRRKSKDDDIEHL